MEGHTRVMSHLDLESSFYDQERMKWIEQGHEGDWAVVRGTTLLGFYPSLEAAYRAGVEGLGEAEFLVKEVTRQDRIERIQRASWRARGERETKQS